MSKIDERHFKEWKNEVKKSNKNKNDFFSYFDTSTSYEQTLMQGMWDFSHHILKDEVLQYLGEPFKYTALEIGFGGGRLLRAASFYFSKVIGIDIHENFKEVKNMLRDENIKNVSLKKSSGKNIPLKDKSVDFVYSFIVMQHFPTLDVLNCYLKEIKRVLKPNKPACLYVGYLNFNFRFKKFDELSESKNYNSRDNTLLLRPTFFHDLLKKEGFKIIGKGKNKKKPWSK